MSKSPRRETGCANPPLMTAREERYEHARLLEQRQKERTYNPGPEMPLASNPAGAHTRFPDWPQKVEESGERVRVTIVVAKDTNRPYRANNRAQQAFETDLSELFGGFTRDLVTGGWVNDDGLRMTEKASRYVVSFDPTLLAPVDILRRIKAAAKALGLAYGQEWVHIESERVRAHHIRCT